MSSILDERCYHWMEPVVQQLYLVLKRLYPKQQPAASVAERAGLDLTFVNTQQAPVYVWHDILNLAAQRHLTRSLVRIALDLIDEQNPLRPIFVDLLADGLDPGAWWAVLGVDEPQLRRQVSLFASADTAADRVEETFRRTAKDWRRPLCPAGPTRSPN